MKTAPEIRLSLDERRQLKELVSKGVRSAHVQTHARILLMAADQHRPNTNRAIAAALEVSTRTVSRTRQRFVAGGLEAALHDRPRSGRPVEIDGVAEAKLSMLACSEPPEGYERWTLQLLADRMVALGYVEHISDTWVMNKLKKTSSALGRSRPGASRR